MYKYNENFNNILIVGKMIISFARDLFLNGFDFDVFDLFIL